MYPTWRWDEKYLTLILQLSLWVDAFGKTQLLITLLLLLGRLWLGLVQEVGLRIDSHELQGLDVVQCTALVTTNHGIVNLIMNEYACCGKGHTILSSEQIEWLKNTIDDRSVQVGGKQRICTIDGYAMPLIASYTFLYLVNPQIHIQRGTQLCT